MVHVSFTGSAFMAEEYQITKEQVLQSIGKEEIEYQIEMKKTIDRIKGLNK